MTELSKPEVIITHESDLDGFVAGALLQKLAQKVFGVEVKWRRTTTITGGSGIARKDRLGHRPGVRKRAWTRRAG